MIRTQVKVYFSVLSSLVFLLYLSSWNIYQLEEEITTLKKGRFDFYKLITTLEYNDIQFNYIVNRHIINENELYLDAFKPFLGLSSLENIRELKLKAMESLDLTHLDVLKKNVEASGLDTFISKINFSQNMRKDYKKAFEFGYEILKLNIEALNAFHGYEKDDKGGYTKKVKPNKQKAIDILYSQKYNIYNKEIQQYVNHLEEYATTLMYRQIEEKKSRQDFYDKVDTVLLLLIGLTILLGIFYSINKIVSPLNQLLSWTKKVEEGEYDLQYNSKEQNELDILMHSFRDMAQKVKENVLSLEKISLTDQLTTLDNRRSIDNKLEHLYENHKRYEEAFSVILLDIDHFKSVNDTYGHDVGDSVLQEFAQILKTNIRGSDIAGRWGGEEFLIVCPNTKYDEVKVLAEHLRQSVESFTFTTVGKKTASFGIATINANMDIAQLVEKADKALYTSKNSGRNCVH